MSTSETNNHSASETVDAGDAATSTLPPSPGQVAAKTPSAGTNDVVIVAVDGSTQSEMAFDCEL